MSPAQKKQTPVRFTDPIRARLDAEARRTGLSISVLVNIALDHYLPPLEGERPVPTPTMPTMTNEEEGLADFD